MQFCDALALRRYRRQCVSLKTIFLAGTSYTSPKFYIALTVGFFTLSTHANDFPVASTTQITSAMASAHPGDTVTMTNKIWQDADVLFKGNGAAGSPITLRAQTPGGVLLSGNSRLRISGNWLVADGLHFVNGCYSNSDVIQFRDTTTSLATNCALLNTSIVDYSIPDAANDNKWVSVYGLSNRVENCLFRGKTNLGTTLVIWLAASATNLSNFHLVRSNFFGPRPPAVSNGGESIRVGDSGTSFTSSRTTVEANYFLQCNGDVEIISSKSCDNTYRYNTFDSCEGTLTLRHGNRCAVYGNWFFGHGLPLTGGIRIIAEDHSVYNNYLDGLAGTGVRSGLTMMSGIVNSPLNGYFQVKRALVAFNTWSGCSNNFYIGDNSNGGTLGAIDCTNANNIIRASAGPMVKYDIAPTNFLWEGNFFYGASVGISSSGISTANPLLALGPDALWRPATNSPVIGAAGGNYLFLAEDFDGQSRLTPKDSGCDQVLSSPVLRHPVMPVEVGPSWMKSAGKIQSTSASGNSVTITWDSLPALSYQVERSTNLIQWSATGSIISNLLFSTTFTDNPIATRASAFYRARLLP
jgi:poly(beta-D-mannuronate) lyase